MMAAGNKSTDNAVVHDLSTAMQSRLIHYELATDPDIWLKWANTSGIDYRVTSYINYLDNRLMDFDPDHNDSTFPCPRTWEFVSKLLQAKDKMGDNAPQDIDLSIFGAIGENIGREFTTFLEIFDNLVTVDQIVKDPEGTKVPNSPNERYALTGTIIQNFKKDYVDPIVTYIKRLPIEFQVITIKSLLQRDPSLLQNPTLKSWIAHTGKQITV